MQARFLGGLEVRRLDGSVIDFPYDKAGALFAFLVMERQVVHRRESLAALFWPDHDSEHGRRSLRTALTHLRKEWGGEIPLFRSDSRSLILDPACPIELDVELLRNAPTQPQSPVQLERMERALKNYRGEFLAGLTLSHCDEFEHWLNRCRESLRRQALLIADRLSDHYEERGNIEGALVHAGRCAEWAPLDESVQERLLRLHAASGNYAAADAHYRDYCRRLETELGAPPGRGLVELFRSLKAQDQRRPERRRTVDAMEIRRVVALHAAWSCASLAELEDTLPDIEAARAECEMTATARGGHVVDRAGAYLLAYFGFPKAIERAAQCAAECALELIASHRLPGVEIRVGMHLGESIGDAANPDRTGHVSALANHLAATAAANHLHVSGEVQRAAPDLPWRAGPDLVLSNAATVRTFTMPPLAVSQEGRAAIAKRPATPFLGRERELGSLLASWDIARQGDASAVMITGEPGIGKSRLVKVFIDSLKHERVSVLAGECEPHASATPFHAFVSIARNLRADDMNADGERARAALRDVFAQPAPAGSAIRREIFDAFTALLLPDPQDAPRILIVEDVQWADPSTLELIAHILDTLTGRPLMLVLTARNETEVPWPQVNHLALMALDQTTTLNLVDALAPPGLSADERRRIALRSDGIPLYLEEMAGMLELAQEGGVPAIPETLHDLLMARIDRLGQESRHVAQVASTLGRAFQFAVLDTVWSGDGASLRRGLTRLLAGGLLEEQWQGDRHHYRFKHALIQEAAYRSQLRRERRRIHLRVAQVITDDFPSTAQEQPERMAHHFEMAGEAARAIDWWLCAGKQAIRRSADREAVTHLQAGLNLLPTHPDPHRRDEIEREFLLLLGAPLSAVQGYGSDAAKRVFRRTAELTLPNGDATHLIQSLWGECMTTLCSSSLPEAMLIARRMLALAELTGDHTHLSGAHYMLGLLAVEQGELDEASRHLECALDCSLRAPKAQVETYGFAIGMAANAYLAHCHWMRGFPDLARRCTERSISIAEQSQHAQSLVAAYVYRDLLLFMLGDRETLKSVAVQGVECGEAHGQAFWENTSRALLLWAKAVDGDAECEAALRAMHDDFLRSHGHLVLLLYLFLSDAALALGDSTVAHEWATQALTKVNHTGIRRFGPPTLLRLGEAAIAASPEDLNRARRYFHEAVAASRAMNARSLELQALLALFRHFPDHETRTLLRHTITGFTEGFDTPDMRSARVLLETLAAPRN